MSKKKSRLIFPMLANCPASPITLDFITFPCLYKSTYFIYLWIIQWRCPYFWQHRCNFI